MPSSSHLPSTTLPLETELRCGRCFKKLGIARLEVFTGRIEILCTRRSRHEACKTLNIYTGTPSGEFEFDWTRLSEGGIG